MGTLIRLYQIRDDRLLGNGFIGSFVSPFCLLQAEMLELEDQPSRPFEMDQGMMSDFPGLQTFFNEHFLDFSI